MAGRVGLLACSAAKLALAIETNATIQMIKLFMIQILFLLDRSTPHLFDREFGSRRCCSIQVELWPVMPDHFVAKKNILVFHSLANVVDDQGDAIWGLTVGDNSNVS